MSYSKTFDSMRQETVLFSHIHFFSTIRQYGQVMDMPRYARKLSSTGIYYIMLRGNEGLAHTFMAVLISFSDPIYTGVSFAFDLEAGAKNTLDSYGTLWYTISSKRNKG